MKSLHILRSVISRPPSPLLNHSHHSPRTFILSFLCIKLPFVLPRKNQVKTHVLQSYSCLFVISFLIFHVQEFVEWITTLNIRAVSSDDVHRQHQLAAVVWAFSRVTRGQFLVPFRLVIKNICQQFQHCHHHNSTKSSRPTPLTFEMEQDSTEALRLTTLIDNRVAAIYIRIQVSSDMA